MGDFTHNASPGGLSTGTDDRVRRSRALLLVLVVALALRVSLWTAYSPVTYNDTGSYRRLAVSVQQGFKRYDGTRTPGYPAFLVLFRSDRAAWLAQMALGLGNTLLLFYLGWRLSGSAWFGGLAGLAHTLNLGQLFFEANLITETLATFWVLLTLAGTVVWLTRRKPWRGVYPLLLSAGLGISASLACLTRPLFIFLPFWVLPFLALDRWGGRLRIRWTYGLAFLLPVLVLLGAWVNFIHDRFRVWSLSAMTGYHLVQHTGHYFEHLSDEHAALRDTYLTFRKEQIKRTGTQTNAIWEAIPAMQEATGLSFYSLSRRLTQLSFRLILDHPDLYLSNVLEGWWLFWRAPFYWSPDALQQPALGRPLGALILAQRGTLFAANLVFVVTSLLALAWRPIRRRWGLGAPHLLLAGSIWIASIVQTLLDHGDNPRFLVPLQSLVVLWVLWIGARTLFSER